MTSRVDTGMDEATEPVTTNAKQSLLIGFAGVGATALEHARVACSLGHRIAAATCRSPKSPRWNIFRSAYPACRFVPTDDELSYNTELDAIIVCLSWDEIPRGIAKYLKLPRRVLLEKPVGLDPSSLLSALDSARESEAANHKFVAMNRRFYEPVARLRARLSQGGLKSVDVVISEDVAGMCISYGPSIVPHVLAYSSCHILDLILHLFGPLSIVRVQRSFADYSGQQFVSINGMLETTAGIPVFLALNDGDPTPVGIRCRFDDKTCWYLSPIERLTVYDGFRVVPADDVHRIRRFVPIERDVLAASMEFKPGFLAQMSAFLTNDTRLLPRAERYLDLLHLIAELRGV